MSLPAGVITLRTIAAGAAGGFAFHALNLPVPWLAGPMIAVAALAMSGIAVRLPRVLCDTGLFVAGISLGSTVSPEALSAIARYPLSIVLLVLCIGGIVFGSMFLLEKLFGWDRPTAFLSSVPGALTMTMALAAETGANAGRVAIVQSIRLFVLVALLPMWIGSGPTPAEPESHAIMTAGAMALVCASAMALEVLLSMVGAISPLFLGGMIASTVLHLTNWAPGALPEPVVVAGFLLIGIWCGVRFEGTTLRMLAGMSLPGLVSLVAVLSVSAAGAWIVHRVSDIPLPEALIALAPGGVEAMILIGASLGLDTLYIGTHHVVRLLVLNSLMPFFVPRPVTPDA